MAFQQNEYAYDLHITDEEWADPLMTKYMVYSSILIILPNDIISFEKEEKENNGDIYRLYNCVAVAMHLENLSVPQAMERTHQIFQDNEVKTKEIQQQLLDRPDNSEDFKKMINCIDFVVGGSFAAHFLMSRYTVEENGLDLFLNQAM